MPIYRFRVQKEDHEDSYRDIDIKPTQSFEEFVICFQEAIKFDGTAVPHFFSSDIAWRKGEEVTPFITTKSGETFPTEIADFVDDPHQRFLLYLDTNGLVKLFHMELIKIIKDETPGVFYPNCAKEVGKPPRQYKKVILPAQAAVDEEDIKLSNKFFEDIDTDDSEAYVAEEVIDGLDESDEVEIKESFGEEGEEEENENEEGEADFDPSCGEEHSEDL